MKKGNLIMKGTLSVTVLAGCLLIGANQGTKAEATSYHDMNIVDKLEYIGAKQRTKAEATSYYDMNIVDKLKYSETIETRELYKELSKEYSKLYKENLYKDEQIKQLGGTPKKLYDEDINGSISYLGKEYPIVQGDQYDIDVGDIRWVDITANYKDIESKDPTQKTSINDNKGLYLAASNDYKFAQDLRDKVDEIVYKDNDGNKLTYYLANRVEIPKEQYKKGWVSNDEEIYKYMAGEAGNVIAIQVTYDDDITTEYLIFKPKNK